MFRKLALRQPPLFRFARGKRKKKKDKPKKKRRVGGFHLKETNVYDPVTAFRLSKLHSVSSFDESVDFFLRLGTDPKRSEFNVRGSCYMPKAVDTKTVNCFLAANDEERVLAEEAGIRLFCNEDMIRRIQQGIIDFDKLYATEEGVKQLKPYARILGPKGLFPNKKVFRVLGTDRTGH